MNRNLLELLRNVMEELDDLNYEVDKGYNTENEVAVARKIAREILFAALTEDGE